MAAASDCAFCGVGEVLGITGAGVAIGVAKAIGVGAGSTRGTCIFVSDGSFSGRLILSSCEWVTDDQMASPNKAMIALVVILRTVFIGCFPFSAD
jgi:hypothetical protein